MSGLPVAPHCSMDVVLNWQAFTGVRPNLGTVQNVSAPDFRRQVSAVTGFLFEFAKIVVGYLISNPNKFNLGHQASIYRIQLKSEVYTHLSQIHLNSVFHNY